MDVSGRGVMLSRGSVGKRCSYCVQTVFEGGDAKSEGVKRMMYAVSAGGGGRY
jgi:hypothetical protein